MNARARISQSDLFSKEFKDINPLIFEGVSDSAAFDNALEYLIIGGYDIEQAMMLMIPEAWEKNKFKVLKLNLFINTFQTILNHGMVPQQCVSLMEERLVEYLIETD